MGANSVFANKFSPSQQEAHSGAPPKNEETSGRDREEFDLKLPGRTLVQPSASNFWYTEIKGVGFEKIWEVLRHGRARIFCFLLYLT